MTEQHVKNTDEFNIDIPFFIRNFKKWFIVGLSITCIFGVLGFVVMDMSHQGTYTAQALVTCGAKNNYASYQTEDNLNSAITRNVSMWNSQALRKEIQKAYPDTTINGYLYASAIEGTGLVQVYAMAGSARDAYFLLDAAMENYQKIYDNFDDNYRVVILTSIDENAIHYTPYSALKYGILGVAGGLFLCLFILIIWSVITDILHSEPQAQKLLDAPVLGTLVKVNSKKGKSKKETANNSTANISKIDNATTNNSTTDKAQASNAAAITVTQNNLTTNESTVTTATTNNSTTNNSTVATASTNKSKSNKSADTTVTNNSITNNSTGLTATNNSTLKNSTANAEEPHVLLGQDDLPMDYLEELDRLTSQVEQSLHREHEKMLMVTSVYANDGKSSVASNLAIGLSKRNYKVLLMDLDLNNPSIYKLFHKEKEEKKSWFYAINRKRDLQKFIVKSPDFKNLHILYQYQSVQDSDSFLENSNLPEHLNKLKESYDFIILDTPPMRIVRDSEVIARMADASLLLIRQDVCHARIANDIIDELYELGANCIGAALNQCEGFRRKGKTKEEYRYRRS